MRPFFAGTLLLLFSCVAAAQVVEIDTRAAAIVTPAPLDVRNRDAVTVRVRHTPILKCQVETKPEALKDEPNVVGLMLQLAGKLFAGGGDSSCPQRISPPQKDDVAAQIDAQLERFQGLVAALRSDREKYYERHRLIAERVRALARCKTANSQDACGANFQTVRRDLETDLKLLLDNVPPSTESAVLLLEVLKKALASRLSTAAGPIGEPGKDWLSNAVARLDCHARLLESVLEQRKLLLGAREEMRKALEVITALQTATDETQVSLRRERESKVVATLTCTNRLTKEIDVSPLSFVIVYHDRGPFVVSAGLLYSFGDKRLIGTQAVRTGVAGDGVITYRAEVAETDSAKYQIVPFTFFNWLPIQPAKIDLGLAAGLGLNANNGGKQIEYLLGGVVGSRNVYVVFGVHRLRRPEPARGFVIGDVLPEKVTTVPIERDTKNVLGIALTYKMPF